MLHHQELRKICSWQIKKPIPVLKSTAKEESKVKKNLSNLNLRVYPNNTLAV